MKIFASYSKNTFTLHINGADTVINLEPHAEKIKVDFVFDNHTGNIDTYSMNVLTTKEPEAETITPVPYEMTVKLSDDLQPREEKIEPIKQKTKQKEEPTNDL